jgi:hypothetical protein
MGNKFLQTVHVRGMDAYPQLIAARPREDVFHILKERIKRRTFLGYAILDCRPDRGSDRAAEDLLVNRDCGREAVELRIV